MLARYRVATLPGPEQFWALVDDRLSGEVAVAGGDVLADNAVRDLEVDLAAGRGDDVLAGHRDSALRYRSSVRAWSKSRSARLARPLS
jgi:hypothetical protein